jgi:hypothetical protein
MSPTEDKVFDPSVAPSEEAHLTNNKDVSVEDDMLLILAGLMEAGMEDDDICKELNKVTKLLTEDPAVSPKLKQPHTPLWKIIDADSIDTIWGFLDMRQSPAVRGYATMATSEFLKASGDVGVHFLTDFFNSKVRRSTYDDYIVAFSVASAIFPVVPDVVAELFLSEGFVGSLGPLMKRKWKSKKVEQAALEMLNVACMNTPCREAIQKYCTEWLDEIVNTPLGGPETIAREESGAIEQRIHSEKVKQLAAIVLAKIQVGYRSFTIKAFVLKQVRRILTDFRIEGRSFYHPN